MEITKEQINKLYGTYDKLVKSDLKKWFPEAFNVELEVGKVYKTLAGSLVKITGIDKQFACKGYGFMHGNSFFKDDESYSWDSFELEATTEEWNAALIEEAKKKHLYGARYFKHANTLEDNTGFGNFSKLINENEIWNKYGCIYFEGVWAEIVKTFSKEEAEKLLGGKII